MIQDKRFAEGFELEAVRLVTERQVSVRESSKRLGVSARKLHQWVKHYAVPP